MPSWIEAIFAFLFKYRPAVFGKGDLEFGAPYSVIILLALAVIIAAPAVLTYVGVRGKSTRQDRWILGALRVAALVVVVICLFRPMLVLSEAVPQRNYVGALVDCSSSMQIADKDGVVRASIATKLFSPDSALLKSLRERFQVRLFCMGASADRIDKISDVTFDKQETHLGDAIERARQELEAVPLSGLVVLTDGADNSRAPIGDQLTALRARGVPVFTIGVGSDRFDKDVEIRRVEAPRSVLKGTSLSADILVRQRGYAGKKVPVIVEDDGKIIAQDSIKLPEDGDIVPVRVHVKLARPGSRTLSFRIPLQDGEQVKQNNAQRTLVTVRDAREKILYVEGQPRYEVPFIRRAVAADSNLQLVTLQRTADEKYLRLDVDDSTELAAGFPGTRGELFKYRSIVLGAVEASFFTRDQLQMLADFVSIRGGGLLFLGGRTSFTEGGYAGTPVADIMPIVVEGDAVADSMTFFADLQVRVTPQGASHSVTQVGPTPEKSAERWRQMATVSSVNYIQRVKPGAVTLLEGVIPTGGRSEFPGRKVGSGYSQPVLVYQRFGRGISIALPVQDTYHWQMDPDAPDDDVAFETFWRQSLRWLTSDVPGRVSVSVIADQVTPNSPITIRADVADSVYAARNDAEVVAHVKSSTGTVKDVPMEWSVNRDGEYRATFTPTDTGMHSIVVESKPKGAGPIDRDSVVVRVGDSNAEYIEAEMRKPLLKRMADETGGRFYTPDNVSTLAEDVAMSKRGVTVINQLDLWDMPIVLLTLLALVGAEWAYRKSRGLA